MQDWRFDDLTRSLGKATSRRQVFKGLLAGVVGITAASQTAKQPVAAASCGGGFKECRQEAADYFHQCRDDGGGLLHCLQFSRTQFDICANSRCPSGSSCCNTGDGYQCIDTASDRDNCGFCGRQCHDANQVCTGGGCTCADGYTECLSGAGNPYPFECCPPGSYCKSGGGCGQTCDPPCNDCQVCNNGTCTADTAMNAESCGSGKVCCSGQCIDECPPGRSLDQSTCECACDTGETCGPYCCSGNKVCCPDVLTGMACKDADPNCPGCQETCGDICCNQGQYCCRAADYSFHCLDTSDVVC